MYAKNLTLNLGVDNVILFQFQNQDQKPVNISGATFTWRMISQNGEDLLLAKQLTTLSAPLGRARLLVTAQETQYVQAQPASWSLEISSGVLEQAVFTDDNCGARGVINIVDSVFPAFQASANLTIPDQAPDSSIYYSSTLTTNGSRLTTFQMDPQQFTGTLRVEGATFNPDTDPEWYNISFQDLRTGNTVSELTFGNVSTRLGINVEGYHPYLRLELGITDGNIDLITYR